MRDSNEICASIFQPRSVSACVSLALWSMRDDEWWRNPFLFSSLTRSLTLCRWIVFDLAAVRAPIDICSCFILNRHRNSSTVYGRAICVRKHSYEICAAQSHTSSVQIAKRLEKFKRLLDLCSILLIDSVRTIVTCALTRLDREMISKCFSIQFLKRHQNSVPSKLKPCAVEFRMFSSVCFQ